MTKETAELIARLNASRDMLKRLNIGDYALIREARDVMADAANGLDSYARTMDRIAGVDAQWAGVLTWLDERARNSRSYGSHADAYEIAARRLREALGAPENPALPAEAASAAASTKNPSKEKR
jgi:hypothetical protein